MFAVRSRRSSRTFAAGLAVVLASAGVVACSSDDDAGDAVAVPSTAETTPATSPLATAASPVTTDAGATESSDGSDGTDSSVGADDPGTDGAEVSATTEPSATTDPGVAGEGAVPPVAAELPSLPPQPEGVPFPTEAWPEGPPVAADPIALGALLDGAVATDGAYGEIDAVVVIEGGQLVAERYAADWSADQVHDSWSVAKSVTHALLGVLTLAGQIDVTAPTGIEAWADDERSEITPDMLARMASGLEWNEVQDAVRLVQTTPTSNVAQMQIDRPLAAPVDTTFNYSTGSTAVNGRLIGDIVGTGDAELAWIDEALLAPLGITTARLPQDADGYWVAGYGANMVARDFARFGLLYLRDGVWDGERILPEGWVDYARSPTDVTDEYGAGFWIDTAGEGTFAAQGFLGQLVVIVPDADAVIVVLADNVVGNGSIEVATEITGLLRAGG